jgi:uncharacterized protein (TIGR02145 family)
MKAKSFLAVAGMAMAFTISCSSDDNEGGGDGSGTSSSSSSACTDNSYGAGSPLTYEGQTYNTVKIGCQTWMAENLNYEAVGSRCYGEGGEVGVRVYYYDDEGEKTYEYEYITLTDSEIQNNCRKHGRLYDWATAMELPSNCNSSFCTSQINAKHKGICPSGWHIPNNDDWDQLYLYADSMYRVPPYAPDHIYNGNQVAGSSGTAGGKLKAKNGWYSTDDDIQIINGTDDFGFAALPGGYYSPSGRFVGDGEASFLWSSSDCYLFFDQGDLYCVYIRGMQIRETRAHFVTSGKNYMYSVRCIQD